jgi:hypothetical protein
VTEPRTAWQSALDVGPEYAAGYASGYNAAVSLYREALEPLYWFYMMVKGGGPDMSDQDEAVMQDAAVAADQAAALVEDQ